jgi:hypothetical protein
MENYASFNSSHSSFSFSSGLEFNAFRTTASNHLSTNNNISRHPLTLPQNLQLTREHHVEPDCLLRNTEKLLQGQANMALFHSSNNNNNNNRQG